MRGGEEGRRRVGVCSAKRQSRPERERRERVREKCDVSVASVAVPVPKSVVAMTR